MSEYAEPANADPTTPSGPGSEAPAHDPEVAEEYAESVGIDPTPEQVREYLRLEGE